MQQQRGRPGKQMTCFQKMQNGFLMGLAVGSGAGVLFGLFTIPGLIKAGFTPAKMAGHCMKTVGTTGFSFGTFMSIGTGIRC